MWAIIEKLRTRSGGKSEGEKPPDAKPCCFNRLLAGARRCSEGEVSLVAAAGLVPVEKDAAKGVEELIVLGSTHSFNTL